MSSCVLYTNGTFRTLFLIIYWNMSGKWSFPLRESMSFACISILSEVFGCDRNLSDAFFVFGSGPMRSDALEFQGAWTFPENRFSIWSLLDMFDTFFMPRRVIFCTSLIVVQRLGGLFRVGVYLELPLVFSVRSRITSYSFWLEGFIQARS